MRIIKYVLLAIFILVLLTAAIYVGSKLEQDRDLQIKVFRGIH